MIRITQCNFKKKKTHDVSYYRNSVKYAVFEYIS